MFPDAMQMAVVKKDIYSVASNGRMLAVLATVTLAASIVIPAVFLLAVLLSPPDSPDLDRLAATLGSSSVVATEDAAGCPDGAAGCGDPRALVMGLILNGVLPLFFLMVPVTASSAMAAGAFIGEKEKNTLETLVCSPLPLKRIFAAKIMASFLVGAAASALSLAVTVSAVPAAVFLATGVFVPPGANWLIVAFLVSPAVSLIAISLIVRGSAKARSFEESQQRASFLVLPIVAAAAAQFGGLFIMDARAFLAAGAGLAVLALFVCRAAFARFRLEALFG